MPFDPTVDSDCLIVQLSVSSVLTDDSINTDLSNRTVLGQGRGVRVGPETNEAVGLLTADLDSCITYHPLRNDFWLHYAVMVLFVERAKQPPIFVLSGQSIDPYE